MTVRQWTEKDIAQISQIEKRCFADPWSENLFKSSLQYSWQHGFVAEEGGQVCGYALLGVLFEDAELLNIAVDLPYRERKIGRFLLDTVHERARALGAKRCLLEVRVSNATAIALYEKFGYQKLGVREKYYEDGESAYVMEVIF